MPAPRAMRLIGKALKQLKKAGLTQAATLRLFTDGGYTAGDIAAGKTRTPTDYPCHVVPSDEDHVKIGGTAVESTDLVYVMPGQLITGGVAPTADAKLIIDGTTYSIVSFENKGSGAAYLVLVRK